MSKKLLTSILGVFAAFAICFGVVFATSTFSAKAGVRRDYYNYGLGSYAYYGHNNSKLKDSGVYSYDYSAPNGENYLFVSLSQRDTLTFSEYIDVTSLDKNDAEPFISTFVLPSVVGVYDFDHLIFTLTDSQNPDIKLNFMANRVTSNATWATMTTYCMAYGNGQAPTGAEYNGSTIQKLHVSDGWGTAFNHSFIKFDSSGKEFDPSTQCINFWYDADEIAVYTKSYGNFKAKVADMDDTYFFGNLWTGFPSGKAQLSVTGTDYNGTRKVNFCIKSIKGLDLSKTIFEDKNPPEITVSTEYGQTSMPDAKIGLKYPVPTATAFDDYDGVRSVRTTVYFSYGTKDEVTLSVRNGCFTPDQRGNYAIVYTAEDLSGNQAKSVYYVHAVSNIPSVSVTAPEEKVTEINLGNLLYFGEPTVNGGSGNIDVVVTVSYNGQKTVIEDGKFRPEKSGTYTVTYTATDYLGQTATDSYDVTGIGDNKSVFVDEIVFPKVLLSGQRYTAPEYYINNYSTGSLVRNLAKLKLTDSNGTNTYSAGETFIPSITEETGSVTVELFDQTVGKSFSVPTITPMYQKSATVAAQVYFDRYFYGEDFAKTKTKNGIVFTANNSSEVSDFIFANPVIASTFKIDFKAFSGEFTSLEIILEDVTNPLNKVSAVLEKNGSSAIIKVGDSAATIDNVFTADGFSIGFNKNNSFTLDKFEAKAMNEDGSEFKGFAEGKAYLTVKFKNIVKGTTFTVNRLCTQTFSTAVTDTFAPEIFMTGNYGGSVSRGDIYTICPAISVDLFAVNVNFTLNVYTTDGQTYAKDINGKELKNVDPTVGYKVKLDEFGQYRFSFYSVETDMGPQNLAQSTRINYIVSVNDTIAPTINVSYPSKTYKVGDSIPVPEYTVSDNKSAEDKITVVIYVYNPVGILTEVKGDGVKCEYAGVYEFRILAIDEAGNLSLKQIKVQVKG